ncbi:MAG: dihydropteroate synthase [Desulfobacterota bacterium]|nr:dihydropteroate synthase [Thermodesulfobacteriota bacterium]
MLIVGESINGTIPKVGEAILNRDETFLKQLARTQYECGAHFLDVNAGVASGHEVRDLPWLVDLVQQEVPIPLMIDSANPEALASALQVYRHSEPPILNSISGEQAKWDRLFPLVIERRCKVVVLLMDDQGIPKSLEEKLTIAQRLYKKLVDAGLPPDHVFFDILVLSIAVEPEAALVALKTMQTIRSHFPNAHLICGVSNVSMGLPARRLINRTFLTMALASGLDTLLIDVRDQALMSSLYAAKALLNEDPYCLEYLKAYREQKLLP